MPSASSSFLFSFFCLQTYLAISQRNIMPGVFLIAGGGNKSTETWISPSGDFAFGFQMLQKSDLYLLAIWYNKIPEKTIVWHARGGDSEPSLAQEGSKLELNSNDGLLLTSPQGIPIWKPSMSIGSNAAYGLMNDTGNFVVADAGDKVLWESFGDPTDTLLPGQILKAIGTGDNQILSSRLREKDFSLGRFQFRLYTSGGVVLNTMNLPTRAEYGAYYWIQPDYSDKSNTALHLEFNVSGYLYVLTANQTSDPLASAAATNGFLTTEYYHRATLNFDGVFVQYSYPKNISTGTAANWSTVQAFPDDICNLQIPVGTVPCGYNSVCQLSQNKRPICRCPPMFSLIDPDDEYGWCKPDFSINTQFPEGSNLTDQHDFVELMNTDWPNSDYEIYKPYDVEECKKDCTQDALCNVISFEESSGTCRKKRLPLSSGRQGDGVSVGAFIKVRKGDTTAKELPFPQPSAAEKKNQNNLVIAVSALLGGSLLINFMLVGVVSFCFFFLQHHKNFPRTERVAESNLRYFSYKELMEATEGFKEELGRGFFGIVYKGQIKMGRSEVPVAIKKLDRVSEETDKEFKTEVAVIGQTHHKNLVQLVGFCNEGQHRLLVYEFLSNGTLASFLFGKIKLSWNQRTQIALGIARGLCYLHDECSTQIIHCDIKPQNILLDENYDAKIADFGLAKLMVLNQSETFTNIRGTKGYVAAEWFRNIPVTMKVDVYSFGVVLLETICCRRNAEVEECEEKAILTYWAYDCFAEGKIGSLIENDDADLKKLERFVMVAIWCIQEDPNLRPTMKMVMLMLEGIIQVPVPPCPYQPV